jgi:deazaflavin-dependent oxidoreductase (nitroreductase family)
MGLAAAQADGRVGGSGDERRLLVMGRADIVVNGVGRAAAALLRVRWLVRAPIWLYRARLGILLGDRLLMLEHTGRRSGRRRHVVLEVVGHPAAHRWIVVSGFGNRSQWYRNLQANPQVRVYVGSRNPRRATASLLDRSAAEAALTSYAAAHPQAWRALRPVLERTLGAPITEAATPLPLIALDLVERPSVGAPATWM